MARDLGPSRTSLPFCGMAIEDRISLGVDGISDPDDIDGVVCAGGIELIAAAAGADSMTSDGRTAVQCAGLPESDDTVTGNTAGASESARACADGATDTADASKTATSAVADCQVSTDAASTAGAPATARGDAGEVTTAAGMPRIANEANDDAATAGALTTGDNADEVEITANAEIVSSSSRYHEYFVRLDVEAGMAEDAPSLSPHKLTWLPAPFDTVQPADAGSPSAAAVSSGSAMNELADIELATTIAMHATLERPADT